ncbi:conserved hypothetical protein [Rubrivivax sp. A210]|uniref:hypothetical protein n=1 Tax=Rubrivivax sp. A210 TaxID=2772301 RepID=UPI001998CC5F|nr:hypothetical protein [Rubrivivax sp. A210]CAD5372741.1 conserved hypothetical protein [Rubrivivax sp. A210]
MTSLHDTAPPWVAFPDMQAGALAQYTKQGATEAWFDQVWRPFWASLSAEQRQRYLELHRASPEWIAAIESVCHGGAALDLEEDARESEAHLREWRAGRGSARPSWFDRLFRRR